MEHKKLLICIVAFAVVIGCVSFAGLLWLGLYQTDGNDCPGHVDGNDDGLCDNCQENVLVSLDFFAINDLHGKFSDTDDQPGVDELSTYLKTAGENTVLISSGDMWQGSSESNLTYGRIMTDWMNELGFVSMTLGNHEFDWGVEKIEENQTLAQFPFLAINIYERDTDTRASFCTPSVMIERAGVQIGIIGAIGDCYSSISSDKVADYYFRTGSELTALVEEEAARLRAQGADLIVYSIHDGYERNVSGTASTMSSGELAGYYDSSLSDGSVDLVFEGHIHKQYVFTDEYGVYHLQGGGENDGISHVELACNLANGNISVTEAEFISNQVYDDAQPDPIVDELLDSYHEQIAIADTVLGENAFRRDGDTLRQLVAQLYYEVGEETWGEDYPIALGGGYISVRSPYNLYAGEVTYADLQALFPFDNTIVLCSVQGSDLKRNFFESSNSNYFIAYGDYGQSIKDHIDPSATYYLITDRYSSTYAPNHLTEIAEYAPDIFARDLLADYIGAGYMAAPADPEEPTLTSLAEVLALGQSLQANQTSREQYYVQGTITEISNAQYGNMTITDENGDSLYVYGVYDATGSQRYGEMTDPPQVGDTVLLCGPVQKYVPQSGGDPTIELYQSRLLSVG